MRIIYHIPLKIDFNRFSASHIRPIKMLEAFRQLGYEVDLVEGYARERSIAIKRIKRNIRKGIKYDFLYSESSTMPTLLTEKHHYPIHPFLDFSFFKFCKQQNIRIGLFYRDIYWVFPSSRLSIKQVVAKLFYKYDIFRYNKLLDVLFLPSVEMGKYIPQLKITNLKSLPPGISSFISSNYLSKIPVKKTVLELLFVGAISGLYDLTMLCKVVKSLNNVHLTICCRKDEWLKEKQFYDPYLNGNISVVHESGERLSNLYLNADIACIYFKSDTYLNFSVPYKLYESISYGCPILANIDTLSGRFVHDNKIGIACSYSEDELLYVLSHWDINILNEFRLNMRKIAETATWEKRCLQVAESLK